ncbi:MAG TPA: murein L,D-transpeptidase catalytic domain family protein [Croceibacterium sp.]|jgi:hypothetical protein
MNMNRRHFVGAAIAMSAGASTALLAKSSPVSPRTASPLLPQTVPAAPQLAAMPPLLQKAMAAMDNHKSYIVNRDRLALVDFSRPSREPRLQLVDVAGGKIERTLLVAHGKGSDMANTGYVQQFSNMPGSDASSQGAYCTADCYYGKHGYSQRLIGLDASNNAALERAIVIHAASYVDPTVADTHGRIGRSWGCFALNDAEVQPTMDWLGQGRMIYADKVA